MQCSQFLLQEFEMNKLLEYTVILLACVVCYFDSLNGNFTYDDTVAIVKNRDVTIPGTSYRTIFNNDFWGHNLTDVTSHKSYRPLTILTFHWEHQLFGLNAFYMKITNFICHCIVCLLLSHTLPVLMPTVPNVWLIGATVLFAVHPIHSEAVCGIVGRAELLCSIFWILGVWIKGQEIRKGDSLSLARDIVRLTLLTLLSIFAVLSKETGITMLLTCLAVDVITTTNFTKFVQREESRWEFYRSRRRTIFRWTVISLIAASTILLRLWIMNFDQPRFKVMDNPVAAADSLFTRVFSQSFLYALNLWLLLCPVWLSFDWALGSIQLIESIADIRILSSILIYIFLGTSLLKGSRYTHIALALMVISFLPATGIIKLGFVIAERVLYIPSIGFCVLIVLGYQNICQRWHRLRHVFHLMFAATVFFMILKTRHRSHEWMTEEILFSSGLKVCPNNAKIYYNIAKLLADKNDRESAFKFYHKAIELYPNYESALMNLGNMYRDENNLELAEKYIRRSIDSLQEFPAAWMNLGIVLASQKKLNESLLAYETALKYRKRYATCYYNMGNLYIDLNNNDMAIKSWQQSVLLDPKQAKAWANLLTFLDNNGLYRDVIRISETALQNVPNDPAVLFTRANAYGKLNAYEEAEIIYKEVIGMRPNYALYYVNLGVLYHRWGRKRNAAEAYENALRINPSLRSVKENLKTLMKIT